MSRSLVALVAVVAVAASPVRLFAQAGLPVSVDQRVRVWTDAPEAIIGRVAASSPSTLQVSIEGRVPTPIAMSAIKRVEVNRQARSRSSHFWRGAMWGAIIGGAAGAVLAIPQKDQLGEDGASTGEAMALGAWSGGLFGGLFGGAIGAGKGGDRWEQVWP
jgi:hypothetical protein